MRIFREFAINNIHKWNNEYFEFQGKYNDVLFEICEWDIKNPILRKQKFKNLEISILQSFE